MEMNKIVSSLSLLSKKITIKTYDIIYYYYLLEKKPGSKITGLDYDLNIKKSIEAFKKIEMSKSELTHYMTLTTIIFIIFLIYPMSFFLKIPLVIFFAFCFLIPLTSQFFLNALPVFTWLLLYFNYKEIPKNWRPMISVKLLPCLESIFYIENLSNFLSSKTNPFLDVLAWIPYGILHFSVPFIVATLLFIYGPPTSLRAFGFSFGYMNLIGVVIQILFPAAPPWYKNIYGLKPANYELLGSPGGLSRIDSLLGLDLYTSAFTNSPIIFGAFPSLHSGCAIMNSLFLCWLFPKYKILWWIYSIWLWWSTMYLNHHYFIDLIGGAILSLIVFKYTKYTHLPLIDKELFCRWSYSHVTKVIVKILDPLSLKLQNKNLSDIESKTSFILESDKSQDENSQILIPKKNEKQFSFRYNSTSFSLNSKVSLCNNVVQKNPNNLLSKVFNNEMVLENEKYLPKKNHFHWYLNNSCFVPQSFESDKSQFSSIKSLILFDEI